MPMFLFPLVSVLLLQLPALSPKELLPQVQSWRGIIAKVPDGVGGLLVRSYRAAAEAPLQ
jgi:hypothetical protein